ncbi:MAG: TrpR-like protein YerC/YecD [Clostridia bacterium]|nr:TrpR-like protein YerC/YecD [Clostridia bacterium]
MITDNMNQEQMMQLIRAVLALENEEEALAFFEDIFTIRELQSVAQRLSVAQLLSKKVTYQEIAETTGASTATISRVNHSLSYGAGGYQKVLAKIRAKDEAKDR